MQKSRIAIIGGGIAGMEAAGKLINMGFEVSLIEKGNRLGGHVMNWHHLFPDKRPAIEVVNQLKSAISDSVDIRFGTELHKISKKDNLFTLNLTDGDNIEANAVIVTTGYDLFDASKKEEYGYGIYENVITSAELEEKLKSGKALKLANGNIPRRVAVIHCVGSRDEKVGNTYCSKVCCVTGVKQAIEIKQLLPISEVYSFYMDLRMFDRYFEELYFDAQAKHGVRFIRGRLSEACENPDHTIILKAEDTLLGKPIKLTVDLVVLLVGFTASRGTREVAQKLQIETDTDKFIKIIDNHTKQNVTNQEGIFVAGACTGPKSITETITDARSAAVQSASYLNKIYN